MAEDTSQTPTQKEYDQDQAGASQAAPDDLTGWAPVQGTQKPAVAPAPADKSLDGWAPVAGTAKPIARFEGAELIRQPVKAPDPTYVGHDFDPLNLEDWKKAYAGPTTAAGQPLTPALKQEGSGISDIFHGDIRKGLSKINAAESMHVVQGSPIEKMIQMINPSFKGGVDQAYVEANSRKDAPLVDSAQFVDKNEHPVVKALTEVAQSLTTPTNTAIMIGTGGLGMVSGPGLAVGNKLLSAGFTAQAVGQAYKNLEGFKKAYDEGNANEAIYQLTHAVANGTMGYIAGANTAGVETPLVGQLEKNVAGKAADLAGKTGAAIKSAGVKTVNAIGSAIGRTTDFDTAIERSSKIPAKQKAAHAEKIANVSEDLQALANEHADTIEDPKTFADAIDNHIKEHEAKLQQTAGATKDSNEPVAPDIEQRLRDRLDKFFDDNRGRFGTSEEVEKAKQEVMDRVLQTVTTPGEPPTTRAPNLFEAENVRRGLNADAAPQYATNAKPTTDAYKVGAVQAANELRSAIDESYDAKGIEGVKEWRQKEANLIDVRDRLKDAQAKADSMGEGGVFRSLMKKIGVPSTVIAIALGHPISGAAIGAAVLGDQISQNLTNPNVNVNRALDIASKNPGAQATEPTYNAPPTTPPTPVDQTLVPNPPPVDHGLHADLATHYGETLDRSTAEDLEERFTSDIDAKLQKGLPLEPEERKLLGKINESKANTKIESEAQAQKDAEKAQAEAKQAADEAEKEKEEKEKLGLNTNLSLPFEVDKELDLPANYVGKGYTGPRLRAHELGHQIMVDEFGHPTGDVISHLHPQINSGAAAEARWDKSAFQDEDGKWDDAKLLKDAPDILAILHGGPIAEEVVHGVPIEKNPGAKGDLKRAKGILKVLGFSPTEIGMMMKTAELKAREVLTTPGVRDIIERYTRQREAGLDETLHMDPETIGQAVQEVRNARGGGGNGGEGASNEGKNSNGVGKGSGEGKSGGKSKAANSAKETTQPAGEAGTGARGAERELRAAKAGGEVKTNKAVVAPEEKSTGNSEFDAAIKAGGGVPGGVSDFKEFGKIVNFHDPLTGSTLGFKEGKEITPETVRAQIQKSRDAFGLKTEKTAESEPEEKYPQAKEVVDGRKVRDSVPNLSSIPASFSKYRILNGVREVSMSDFDAPPEITARTKKLAAAIKESGEINPLIVAVDKDGPYILEGGHRYDALRMSGAKSFPAKVVIDLDDVAKKVEPKEDHDKAFREHQGEQ